LSSTFAAPRRAFHAELYGLTSQLRRSAVSVPSNVAEGCCRSQGDFGRFIQIAAGSASELEYQLLLAKDLDLLQIATFQALSIEVKRMLAGLLARLTTDG
jgi:four helix bundle protein